MSEEEWREVPIVVRRRSIHAPATCVFSFRLTTEEMGKLEEAAEKAGQTAGEYVRQALAMRLSEEAQR